MKYHEKLKDPRWQKKRLKVMEYADFRCQICGAKNKTLNVHHSYYTKGKNPWQYRDGSLICICEGCHEKIHGPKKIAPTDLVDQRGYGKSIFAELHETSGESPTPGQHGNEPNGRPLSQEEAKNVFANIFKQLDEIL